MNQVNIKQPFSGVLLVLFLLLAGGENLSGQDAPWESQFNDLLPGGQQDDDGPEYQFSGNFSIDQGKRTGTLNVILDIKEGWHGYSQKKLSGQEPTVLDVKPAEAFKVTGPFTPDQKPKKKKIDLGDGSQGDVEEFEGRDMVGSD